MFLLEDNFIISKKYMDHIDSHILGNDFPWFWQSASTSPKFPFLSHTLIPRYPEQTDKLTINSEHYDFFHDIFDTFCILHKIKVEKILRASLNLSLPFNRFPFTDPHVDHNIPHLSMLMYLNDCTGGNTVLFKETTDGTVLEHPIETVNETLSIAKEIVPQKGKIAVFDGLHYHAHRFCEESQRRVVCVFTFQSRNH